MELLDKLDAFSWGLLIGSFVGMFLASLTFVICAVWRGHRKEKKRLEDTK